MKRTMKNFFYPDYEKSKNSNHGKRKRSDSMKFAKTACVVFLMMLTGAVLRAQTVSGTWDAAATAGTTGYTNWNNGVIQLLSSTTPGCVAAAVHETSVTYNPTSGATFNKCYQVFFGCPGNDDIGSDTKGDGMAFSFWRSNATYNINNGQACGGGLGYMGSASDGKMLTIEFDTYSSQGNSGFDASYGGGTTGNNDEIALHRDGQALDGGRITSVNAGNLEDGLEHTVCISYDPATHILAVSIDGASRFSYNLTGSPYDLATYFGNIGLNQTWSSGQNGAFDPATVSDGVTSPTIAAQIGGSLCPANVAIVSPSGNVASDCGSPITITASVTPPAGNTVSYVEFFVDGVSIGTDNTSPYSIAWNNPTSGSHALTATAHYSPSNTSTTSSTSNVNVTSGIAKTSNAPTIDGTIDASWSNYPAMPLTKVLPLGTVSGAADLSATFRTMRDATHLYILVEVTDDILIHDGTAAWEDDGVEIMIDMGNKKNGTYGATDYQFNFGYNSTVITEYYHGTTGGITFAQGAKTGGYIMEISIPWATLGTAPNDGDQVGFEVQVNDDDDGGTRDAKIGWNDGADQAFHNPSAFGTLRAAACDPCPTAVLTGTAALCNGITSSPLTVTFTGTGPWSFTYAIDGVAQPAVNNIATSPYVFPSATGAHTYTLVSVSNGISTGCTGNATGTAIITIHTLPVGHDASFIAPGTATLSVDNSGGTYQWYDSALGGNLVFTGAIFTTSVLNESTNYYVQEASAAPCRVQVRALAIINSAPIFIPNLVTPNSDGKNDQFEITALPTGSTLNIYNRWGDRVYQSTDYDNQWAGVNASDGVYYYDLVLPGGNHYKGWINIVR